MESRGRDGHSALLALLFMRLFTTIDIVVTGERRDLTAPDD